jgi:hypothetical protein
VQSHDLFGSHSKAQHPAGCHQFVFRANLLDKMTINSFGKLQHEKIQTSFASMEEEFKSLRRRIQKFASVEF